MGASREHPFWVDGQGWVKAHELSEGQTFGSASGSWLRVSGATWTNIRTTVYNLEVEDFHTYFVGEGGVWVHNSCGGAGRVARPSDATVVCRGGSCTAARFSSGSGVTTDAAGKPQGVSVNAAESLEAASKGIPHGKVLQA